MALGISRNSKKETNKQNKNRRQIYWEILFMLFQTTRRNDTSVFYVNPVWIYNMYSLTTRQTCLSLKDCGQVDFLELAFTQQKCLKIFLVVEGKWHRCFYQSERVKGDDNMIGSLTCKVG